MGDFTRTKQYKDLLIAYNNFINFIQLTQPVRSIDVVYAALKFYRVVEAALMVTHYEAFPIQEAFEQFAKQKSIELPEDNVREYHEIFAAMSSTLIQEIAGAGMYGYSAFVQAVKIKGKNFTQEQQLNMHKSFIPSKQTVLPRFPIPREIDEIERSFRYWFNPERFLINLYKLRDKGPQIHLKKLFERLSDHELKRINKISSESSFENLINANQFKDKRNWVGELQEELRLFKQLLQQTLLERKLVKPAVPTIEPDLQEGEFDEVDVHEEEEVSVPPVSLLPENTPLVRKFIQFRNEQEFFEKEKLIKMYRLASLNHDAEKAEIAYFKFNNLLSSLPIAERQKELKRFFSAGKHVTRSDLVIELQKTKTQVAELSSEYSLLYSSSSQRLDVEDNQRVEEVLNSLQKAKIKFTDIVSTLYTAKKANGSITPANTLNLKDKNFRQILSSFGWWFSRDKLVSGIFNFAADMVEREKKLFPEKVISPVERMNIYTTNLMYLLRMLPKHELKNFAQQLKGERFQGLITALDYYVANQEKIRLKKDNRFNDQRLEELSGSALGTLSQYLVNTVGVVEKVLTECKIDFSIRRNKTTQEGKPVLHANDKDFLEKFVNKFIQEAKPNPVVQRAPLPV